jgi:hypothetical protein
MIVPHKEYRTKQYLKVEIDEGSWGYPVLTGMVLLHNGRPMMAQWDKETGRDTKREHGGYDQYDLIEFTPDARIAAASKALKEAIRQLVIVADYLNRGEE